MAFVPAAANDYERHLSVVLVACATHNSVAVRPTQHSALRKTRSDSRERNCRSDLNLKMPQGTLSHSACGRAQARNLLPRQCLLRPCGNVNLPFRHIRTFRTVVPHAAPAAAPAPQPAQAADPQHAKELQELDDRLSNRPLALDPAG